jgi:anaerobic magnesium-protoporphyrin IX monomethyl ester cyclase
MRPLTAVLVGPSLQGNLALEYLGASAQAAGHRAELVSFDSRAQAASCAKAIAALSPDLVGLSIAFQCAVDDSLELLRLLRLEGYRGHVTCGGHVPTFCARELLEATPDLDSAVRHEGERALVEILDALGRGEAPRGIAGLVWREDREIRTGPPRRLLEDLDSLPHPLRRSKPLVVGGAPIAVMLASRGCIGECSYCCLRAFGADAGGKRFRMRSPDAVADEIATAYHELGVRVVIFQDDLFILPSEAKSVARMRAIRRGMDARGVGRVVFWIKGRPETITERVAEAAHELGAIHMFLGVENAASERLKYLGRTHARADNERAIRRCLDHGIRSSYNIMLFDPDCSLEEIEENIGFGAEHLEQTWNVCRTEVYPGTPLLERLRAEGRLDGDWRAYGYTMRDPRAELMFRVLRVAFDRRAFTNESLLNRLINLSFTRHVHEAFLPGAATAATSARVDALVREVYADTVGELRRVAAFARDADPADVTSCQEFAIDAAMAVNERDHAWHAAVDDIGFLLDARGARIRGAGAAL